MKDKNALARVILWAVIVVILCGAFVGVLLRDRRKKDAAEPAVPSVSAALSQENTGSTADNTPAASDNFSGKENMQLPDSSEPVRISVSEISRIEVDWLSGSVTVQRADGDSIEFSEDYQGEEKYRLRYSVENGVLHIQVCQSGTILNIPEKALTLSLPNELYQELKLSVGSAKLTLSDVRANELELDSISGGMELDRIEASELQIDTTSGSVRARSLTVSELEVSSISGDAELEGAFDSVDAEMTSGSVSLTAAALPHEIDVSTISGNITLTLPRDSAFLYEFDTLSGRLTNSLPNAASGSDAAVEIDTTSGSLTLQPLD